MHGLTDDDADRCFKLLLGRPLLLAVSGGADSTALMHLVSEWRRRQQGLAGEIRVTTVDHCLRPGSDAEAQWVGRQAFDLGFHHTIRTWQGRKPDSGIQAAAREARYGLLLDEARALSHLGRPCIVTAHHLDDQVETFLMRLARGSGLDGLSAMPVSSSLGEADLVRPLLSFSKTRLTDSLEERGVTWIEDPSNECADFERVRLRKLSAHLAEAGLTATALGRSARRLERARQSAERTALATYELLVDTHGGLYAQADASRLFEAGDETAIRVLDRTIRSFGGNSAPPRLLQLETLLGQLATAFLDSGAQFSGTLGGTKIRLSPSNQLYILREQGREPLPSMQLKPGATLNWDARFQISLLASRAEPIMVKALGSEGCTLVKSLLDAGEPSGIDREGAQTLPSMWAHDGLCAVPYYAEQLDALQGGSAGGLVPGISANWLKRNSYSCSFRPQNTGPAGTGI